MIIKNNLNLYFKFLNINKNSFIYFLMLFLSTYLFKYLIRNNFYHKNLSSNLNNLNLNNKSQWLLIKTVLIIIIDFIFSYSRLMLKLLHSNEQMEIKFGLMWLHRLNTSLLHKVQTSLKR